MVISQFPAEPRYHPTSNSSGSHLATVVNLCPFQAAPRILNQDLKDLKFSQDLVLAQHVHDFLLFSENKACEKDSIHSLSALEEKGLKVLKGKLPNFTKTVHYLEYDLSKEEGSLLAD